MIGMTFDGSLELCCSSSQVLP